MLKRSYTAGARAALAKFAVMTPGMEHGLDIAGLGMLAAPVAHDMFTHGEPENPWLTRAKHLTELAGLGVLAAKPISHFLNH